MLLNDPTMVARSGSSVGGSRVCSPPAPIWAAAVATTSRGAISRRSASRPNMAPARVASTANAVSTMARVPSVERSSAVCTIS